MHAPTWAISNCQHDIAGHMEVEICTCGICQLVWAKSSPLWTAEHSVSICGMKEPINGWMNKLLDFRPRTNMVKGSEIWVLIRSSVRCIRGREWMGSWVGCRMQVLEYAFSQKVGGHHQSSWRGRVSGLDLYFRCAFSHNSLRLFFASKYEHKCEWLNAYKNSNMWKS